MNLRKWAIVFGLGFIVAGIAGFVPALSPDGYLLGIFGVNPLHNLVHLLSGIIALYVASKIMYAKLYFRVFGIVYGLVAIYGFMNMGNPDMMMHMNTADAVLHAAIAVVSLYIGFSSKVRA